jgi:uncharacterized protein YdhG (YjbR/CyaY superfamily)
MQSNATTVAQYLKELPEDRQAVVKKLHKTIVDNLPAGFEACMGYGMIGYVVPHSLYKEGYHCDPKLPLPFMNVASQKNFIAVYHMGVYSDSELLKWFQDEYTKLNIGKLDMGKSCIRFKNPDKIPFELIGKLATKMTVKKWIACYESVVKSRK